MVELDKKKIKTLHKVLLYRWKATLMLSKKCQAHHENLNL